MSPLLADVAPIPDVLGDNLIVVIVAGAIGLLIVGGLLVMLARSLFTAPAAAVETQDLSIDVTKLAGGGPPATGPQLECYNIPVRLAVLVLAPLGRGGAVPPAEALNAAVDQIVPGLKNLLPAHAPIFRRWPPQLSAAGFSPAFFAHIPLPGDGGKGTPWCGVTGRFEFQGQALAVGMILRADQPNGLGQIALERDTQWLDVLRVRNA